MQSKFYPNCYIKSVYDIPVALLKKRGIKTICFDFDNTLIGVDSKDYEEKVSFLKKLSKSFEIIIISNSFHGEKVKKFANLCNIRYITHSFKPFKKGFLKAQVDFNKTAMVGDQLITDVFGAKRLSIFAILVDPISKEESIGTKINRIFERLILSRLKIKRGDYYEQKV